MRRNCFCIFIGRLPEGLVCHFYLHDQCICTINRTMKDILLPVPKSIVPKLPFKKKKKNIHLCSNSSAVKQHVYVTMSVYVGDSTSASISDS